jgi:hypothetical protein
MIDTQQQYINLNIRGEISIIVVQAHSGVFDMKTDEWYHFYFVLFYCPERNRWFTPRPIALRYSPVESIGACMIILSNEDCRSISRSRVTDDSGTAELCYILCILCDVISLRYRKTFVRILKNFCTEKKYISF